MTLRELSLSSLIQAKMELLTASGDEELHDAQGPYAVIAQVDNYVKDQGTRRHLLGGGVNNFVQAATETRMAAGCRTNTLDADDEGYGEPYSHVRLMDVFGEDKTTPHLLDDNADSIWSFKDTVVTVSSLFWFSFFMIEDLPKDTNGPFRLRDHVLAPQVGACSASRKDFKTHVLLWLKATFGAMFVFVHIFFVFDTEYIPHYMSWLARGGAAALILYNTAVFPCKFHIRKHLAETLLAKKPVLRFILAPLLTTKLVVSVKKWSQVRKAAEDDAAAADAEDQAAAESLEAVARLVEEAQAQQFTAEPEEPRRSGAGRKRKKTAKAAAAAGGMEEEGGAPGAKEEEEAKQGEEEEASGGGLDADKAYAAEERHKFTEERDVKKIKS